MRANRAWASRPYTCTRTHIFTNVQFRFVTKPCLLDGRADVCDTSDSQPILVHLSRDESGETQRLSPEQRVCHLIDIYSRLFKVYYNLGLIDLCGICNPGATMTLTLLICWNWLYFLFVWCPTLKYFFFFSSNFYKIQYTERFEMITLPFCAYWHCTFEESKKTGNNMESIVVALN